MKRLFRAWILFASWSLLVGVAILRAHLQSGMNPLALDAPLHTPMPATMLAGWPMALTVSYPAFACVFYFWQRLSTRALSERLGLLQFCMATLPQILVPIAAVGILIAHGNEAAAERAGRFSGNLSPDLLSTLKNSIDIIVGSWFASLLVFIYNLTATLRDRK